MWKWTESTEMEWNAEFAKRPMASFALRIRYADNNKCIGNERTKDRQITSTTITTKREQFFVWVVFLHLHWFDSRLIFVSTENKLSYYARFRFNKRNKCKCWMPLSVFAWIIQALTAYRSWRSESIARAQAYAAYKVWPRLRTYTGPVKRICEEREQSTRTCERALRLRASVGLRWRRYADFHRELLVRMYV